VAVEPSPEITVAHVQAVHDAAHDSGEEADRREDRMLSAAKAIRERATQLREVEWFLLQLIPEYQQASHLAFARRPITQDTQ
jgi:hypothetical protein